MSGHPILRTVAVAASAALLLIAIAGPASAAKPKCQGKTATIVGTNKGEVIRGTRKADVIVARGGHDRVYGRGGNDTICGGGGHDKLVGGGGHDFILGQLGRDKLFGGPGRDRLLGGPANDYLNGGTGNDLCAQGAGAGPRVNCERPQVAVPVPVPVVLPPPPPPDADGDGVPDGSDTCPAWGDAGYGLDARGCPIYPDFETACEGLDGSYVGDHFTLVPPHGHIPVPACYWTGITCWDQQTVSQDWTAAREVLEPHCVSLTGGRCSDLADPDIHVCNPCPPLGCEE